MHKKNVINKREVKQYYILNWNHFYIKQLLI